MMREQISFTEIEYLQRRKTTKREAFLREMDRIVPWEDCVRCVQAVYPKGERGRKPISVETMLRMYLLQTWFNASAKGIEEAIYDSFAMKQFMRIRFDAEQVPDATTLRKFRKLLEKNGLQNQILQLVHSALKTAHKTVRPGSIADAAVLKTPLKRIEGDR